MKKIIPSKLIQKRVCALARAISKDYRNKDLVVIAILKGSVIFFADLIRQLGVPFTCEFMVASSYGKKMKSSGKVKMPLMVDAVLRGKDVLIIEDIVDSGLTMAKIISVLKKKKPRSLKICSLLVRKNSTQRESVDYTGFAIGDEFVVGYGLDHAGKYRGLKDIRAYS